MDFTSLGNKTQTINLSKNTGTLSIDLTKRGKPLVEVYFGASWDPVMSGRSIDIDTTAIAVASDGKWHEASDVLFYNNLQNAYMEHSPDDLDGSSADGDADDEFIKVNLVKAPDYIQEIILVANIFEADKLLKQTSEIRHLDQYEVSCVSVKKMQMARNWRNSDCQMIMPQTQRLCWANSQGYQETGNLKPLAGVQWSY